MLDQITAFYAPFTLAAWLGVLFIGAYVVRELRRLF